MLASVPPPAAAVQPLPPAPPAPQTAIGTPLGLPLWPYHRPSRPNPASSEAAPAAVPLPPKRPEVAEDAKPRHGKNKPDAGRKKHAKSKPAKHAQHPKAKPHKKKHRR